MNLDIHTSDEQYMLTLENKLDDSFDEDDPEYSLFKGNESGIALWKRTETGSYMMQSVLDPDKVVEMAKALEVSERP